MGVLLSCHCENCNYAQSYICLGYLMTQGIYYFPAYNSRNKSVVEINIYQYLAIEEFNIAGEINSELKRLKKARKYPYFLSNMYKKTSPEPKILSEIPYLQSQFNFCPQCKTHLLAFEETGLCD